MNKKNYTAVGAIIYAVGVIVLVIAAILLSPLFVFRMAAFIFTCASAFLIYTAMFLPAIIGLFRGSAASVIAGGTVYYKGVSVYSAVSVFAAVLSFILPVGVAIAVQCVALFILLIWLCMAVFTNEHIESTQQKETAKMSCVKALREKANRLSVMSSSADGSIRRSAEKIAENMRYLSPAGSAEAHDAEQKMLALLDSMIRDDYFGSAGAGSSASLEQKFAEFDAVYSLRKTMY